MRRLLPVAMGSLIVSGTVYAGTIGMDEVRFQAVGSATWHDVNGTLTRTLESYPGLDGHGEYWLAGIRGESEANLVVNTIRMELQERNDFSCATVQFAMYTEAQSNQQLTNDCSPEGGTPAFLCFGGFTFGANIAIKSSNTCAGSTTRKAATSFGSSSLSPFVTTHQNLVLDYGRVCHHTYMSIADDYGSLSNLTNGGCYSIHWYDDD